MAAADGRRRFPAIDPKLLPFKRREGKPPLILAHRGARRDAPENTLAAFELALEQGADGVELDVRMTRDAELFLTHDDAIELHGGEICYLSELTGSQVRHLRTASGEPLPTLRDALVFAARTGALLNVELKGDVVAPLHMARLACRQLEEFGGIGVLLSSFSVPVVWELLRTTSKFGVAQLMHQKSLVPPAYYPLRRLGVSGVHPQFEMLSADLAAHLRNKATLLNTWTVNDPDKARLASSWGVDAIITDVPAALCRIL